MTNSNLKREEIALLYSLKAIFFTEFDEHLNSLLEFDVSFREQFTTLDSTYVVEYTIECLCIYQGYDYSHIEIPQLDETPRQVILRLLSHKIEDPEILETKWKNFLFRRQRAIEESAANEANESEDMHDLFKDGDASLN